MSNFKKATRAKLRFSTSRGVLSTEQLWDLPQTTLVTCIRAQKKLVKKTDDDELAFLDSTIVVDTIEQLKFDVLKDVYMEKKNEASTKLAAKKSREHNDEIYALIAEKEGEAKKGMTIDELKKQLLPED